MRAGSRQRKLLIAGVILLGAGLLFRPIRGDENPQFARWEQAIAALERQDQDQPPPKNAIVFVGSSTIRLWDLETGRSLYVFEGHTDQVWSVVFIIMGWILATAVVLSLTGLLKRD